MPVYPRPCLFFNVPQGTTLGIRPRSPQPTTEERSQRSFPLDLIVAVVALPLLLSPPSSWTPIIVGTGVMAIALSLPPGAIVAAPTKIPTTIGHYGSQLFTILVSTLRLASHYQRLLSRAFLPLFLQASILAAGLLGLGRFVSMRTCQVTRIIAYHTARLSKQAAWRLWNSTHTRRLRKKIEFEFFTLILGAGGNNLCLVLFWPGWGVLGLAVFVLSVWYAA
ncbi:hypothetical protein F5Y09DRAFT_138577 [Xylaria sp. FL1042]|nr:hypothetical protein F5Y09DRAFT_138577 [Xylaria sp. FL1042]